MPKGRADHFEVDPCPERSKAEPCRRSWNLIGGRLALAASAAKRTDIHSSRSGDPSSLVNTRPLSVQPSAHSRRSNNWLSCQDSSAAAARLILRMAACSSRMWDSRRSPSFMWPIAGMKDRSMASL